MSLAAGWQIRLRRRYAVGEHNYEITELPETSFRPVVLGDWRQCLGADFSGDAEYRVEFDFHGTLDGCFVLNLGKVCYAVAITLNGKKLGNAIWPPFQINATGAVQTGRNVLVLTVTNSLANAILAEGVAETWQQRCGREWPDIKYAYHQRQLEFEKDSLPSGLFGPVRLLQGVQPCPCRHLEHMEK